MIKFLAHKNSASRTPAIVAVLAVTCPHCKAAPTVPCDPFYTPPELLSRLSPEGQFMSGGELVVAHNCRIALAIYNGTISRELVLSQYADNPPPDL